MKPTNPALFEQFKKEHSLQCYKTNEEKSADLAGALSMMQWIDGKAPSKETVEKILKLADDSKAEWLLYVQTFSNFDENINDFRIKYICNHWNDNKK